MTSVAKYVGVVYTILGIFYGFVALFAGLAATINNDAFNVWQSIGLSIAIVAAALLVVPLVSFALGWLHGAIVSIIVNFILQTSSGIEVDVDELAITDKK